MGKDDQWKHESAFSARLKNPPPRHPFAIIGAAKLLQVTFVSGTWILIIKKKLQNRPDVCFPDSISVVRLCDNDVSLRTVTPIMCEYFFWSLFQMNSSNWACAVAACGRLSRARVLHRRALFCCCAFKKVTLNGLFYQEIALGPPASLSAF